MYLAIVGGEKKNCMRDVPGISTAVGDLGFEDEGLTILFADQVGGLGRCYGIAVDDHDPCALTGKRHGSGTPVTAARADRARAGDQRDLARQTSCYRLIP